MFWLDKGKKSWLGNWLFLKLITNICLQVEKRQSSTRRRYSSQYVVRRDYFVGCKKLFDTSMQNIGESNQENASATNVTLDDPAFHEKQVIGSINQVCLSLFVCKRHSLYLLQRKIKVLGFPSS